MGGTRVFTWLFSLAAHVAIGWFLLVNVTGASLEAGSGHDPFKIEQGVGIESIVGFGDATETTMESVDAQPVQPVTATDATIMARETKNEVPQVIASAAQTTEEVVTITEPERHKEKPAERKTAVAPAALAASEPASQVNEAEPRMASIAEIERVQAANVVQHGGTVTIISAYSALAHRALERHKVNPRTRISGVVVVRFTVAPSGHVVSRDVVSSSGSKLLDDAALATVDRASPLPPLPEKLAEVDRLTFSVSFHFLAR